MCVLLSPKYSYDKCCYVPVFWFITPWTSLSRLPPPANVTVNAPRTMFKHESPNKRIPARCKGAIFVVFCSETNLTTVEFDPGRPYLMALEHYVQRTEGQMPYHHLWNAIASTVTLLWNWRSITFSECGSQTVIMNKQCYMKGRCENINKRILRVF